MIVLTLIIAVTLVYVYVARRLLAYFARYEAIQQRFRYPNQIEFDSVDVRRVLSNSTYDSCFWPFMLPYIAYKKRAMGNSKNPKTDTQIRRERLDKRLGNQNVKTYEQLIQENARMAEQLGLETDEYR